MLKDDLFVDALKHGMPPTAGLGMGIELIMLLTDQQNIKEVILFPTFKTWKRIITKFMLDINKIIADPKFIAQKFSDRCFASFEDSLKLLEEVVRLDKQRRELINKLEKLQAERNLHSKSKPSPK